MSVAIGNTYGFKFKTGFDSLNGIYTITHGLSWDSLLLEEIDLFATLYEPAGKLQGDLDTDIADLSLESFYRLVNVEDESIVYMPRSYINGIPVPDVFKYQRLMLSVDLGLYDDPDTLVTLRTSVAQVLEGQLGTTTDVNVVIYGSKWLTEGDYEQLAEARALARTGVVNYYSEVLKKDIELAKQSARIVALEEIVRLQDEQLNP
jgi:hypothetical protein